MGDFNPWIVLVVVFISMSVHELLHAITSFWLGDDTAYLQGRITLNPLKSIDPIYTLAVPFLLAISGSHYIFGAAKPVQVNFSRLRHGEFGGALVGLAGPLTNLAMAVVAAIIFRHIYVNSAFIYQLLFTITAVNAGFFVFNMIPWPPLDGSRVLYAFSPRPLQEFMESVERMGMNGLILFLVVFYFVLGAPLGFLIRRLTGALLGLPVV